MFFRQISDPGLAQYAYLIGCQRTGEAIVIDPERDIDRYLRIAEAEALRIVAATETHIHADFLSGVRELGTVDGVTLYLSDEGDEDWKYGWVDAGTEGVVLLRDGDTFRVGNIELRAMHTPGHTPEHLSFLVTDLGGGATEPMGIASGDFVFVGDVGRPDLLESAAGVAGAREPSARSLFESRRRFLSLPDHVQVWPGHGAGSACGKALGAIPQSTVGYERRFNPALAFDDESAFVASILDGQPEPPPYFARMKALNRDGVPLLGGLSAPLATPADQLLSRAEDGAVTVIDTRTDRAGFMADHIAGSIYAPLGVSFPLVVGSYVDPQADLHLVVDEADLDRAVRSLVRIGYDRVVGYTAAEELLGIQGLRSIEVRPMPSFDPGREAADATLLDVRGAAEYAGAHLPGAVNVAHTRLAPRLEELRRDRPVAVYCRTGARASSAASFLEREGFDVTLVDGSIAEWPGFTTATAGTPAG